MRLIDADELREQVESRVQNVSVGSMVGETLRFMNICCVEDIDNAPTIDAMPVKHGYWERRKSPAGFVYYTCTACENCNWLDDFAALKKYYYCPHCGAKMQWKGESE